MRVMAYLGTAIVLLSLWGAWLLHRRRLDESKWFQRVAIWAVFTPFVMNTAGWLLTENGRQPWIVQGLMKTADGVSPSVSTTEIWISLAVFALLYLALGVVELVLMLRYARRGLPDESAAKPSRSRADVLGGTDVARDRVVRRRGVLLDRLLRPRGLRLRRRRAAPVVGRDEDERRVAINAIGPFWDGNEVWLIVAGAAMFAAFPAWYATLFSGLYLAMLLILVALIVRGVAFEFRGKSDAPRWRRTWTWATTLGSGAIPLLLGIGLGALVAGLPIGADGEFTGGVRDIFTAYGVWFGLTLLVAVGAARRDVPGAQDERRGTRALAHRRPCRSRSRRPSPCSSSRSGAVRAERRRGPRRDRRGSAAPRPGARAGPSRRPRPRWPPRSARCSSTSIRT